MNSILSIIIPTYSSINQLQSWEIRNKPDCFNRIEFIFIDSLSNDGSSNVLNYLSNKYSNIFVYYLKSNIYEAMNFGVHKSKSNWILFKGVDDNMLDSAISFIYYIEANPQLSFYDLLIVDYQIVNDKKIRIKNSLNQLSHPHHQSCIFNIDALQKMQYIYNPKYKIFSDMDLIFRLLKNKKTIHLPFSCISFSKGGKSTSGVFFIQTIKELTLICNKNNKLLTSFYCISLLRLFFYYINNHIKNVIEKFR